MNTYICHKYLKKGKVIVNWRSLENLHEGSFDLCRIWMLFFTTGY